MKLKNLFRKDEPEQKVKTVRREFKNASSLLDLHTSAEWTAYHGRTLLQEGFERNSWAYACIKKKMAAVGSVPLRIRRENSDGEVEDLPETDALQRLMANPCEGVTASQFVKQIVAQLDVQGIFYAQVIRGGRGGNVPLEVFPLPIGSVKTNVRRGVVDTYEVTSLNGGAVKVAPQNMLVVKYTGPDGALSVMSPTAAGGKAIDTDNAAADLQKISMDNRGVPDGIFYIDIEDDPDGDEFEEARNIIRSQYATRDSFREPWVLQNAKFEKLSQSLSDLDFMQGRAQTRTEICSVLEVPPPLVGIYDNATLANIETARKIFWRDTILPLLADIADQLKNGLIGNRGDRDRIFFEFDITNVTALRESFNEKLDAAQKLAGMGVPLSEINRRLELSLSIDDIPGAQTAWMPSNAVPVSGGGADGSNTLSDSDFERIEAVVSKVAAGDLTIEGGVALVMVGVSNDSSEMEQRIRRILEGVVPDEKSMSDLDDKGML